ncbi:PREDICTED: rho GTPase-activating protein 27 isoform X1 [Dipodomys ordii]|uniref:Rho GTPase-activating protein 27 isoform X1 n=1 Tax=Dipodomys ordii TaxID=10020 RepID=A0A1S3GF61_DIPOR|nr:PREDICTED: rho GTPase-activating protein 27 isoform X1 [Dipodomys ordii]XP_012887493.1 PREDICTED: rho GTPase-activating protein 27 isoform X1 [Dipodomys ordii]XP_012887494.1 PREDICTED: rho GTPase-activating protein 27 isoform X1 [Dipodomys ordii]XP_012887495.1 PREDICTED: rho GTPase-activating protein 27 isoform X1 [Dipodomys ordii]XP_012887496.1 PREDICTED: rho GTPase-activating protein 27 isoform X1 [Dipodomys ordii]XP_012887498.1 PREDICTED: rho GTPase-activating protein 27 isoform X1 [Dipo
MAADVEGDVYVLVEHPFEYTSKDGRRVAIQPNERYRLLRRSTEHWWHVRGEPGGRPFYLPAQYVRELPALGDPAPTQQPVPQPRPAVPEPLAYDYRFVSAHGLPGPDGTIADSRGRASSLCGPARHRTADPRRSPAPGQPSCLYVRPLAPVRPAQSLDDLARPGAAPSAGLLGSTGHAKACSVAGSWVCPRPLARSDSENVYEAIQDMSGPAPPQDERPKQVDDLPEPVYANIERQPQAPSPHVAVAPRPSPVWETHTDVDTGRPYYYNPDTGVTTWESPFETAEGATSPATSPASVGSQESLETEWGQYWDEESRRVFFYNPLTGETAWEEEPEDDPDPEDHLEDQPQEELEMQPCLSPSGIRNQRPPTPETDYPELLTSYPEEDYSPVGSFNEPSLASPLTAPPGWSCHVGPDKQMLYTNHFTQEQWVRLEDQHGKPYFYKPEDSSVQWELPQVPVPAPRSICKSSQDSDSPAQASPPEEKIKTLDKAGVLHRTKTVDKGKRLRKKHWSASWTVLEGGILTFFKDSKTSAAGGLRQPSKLSTPEYTVELKGASLSWAPKDKSSKKNVLELRSRDGSEYLIQHDSEAIISTWHKAISQGIEELSADLPLREESETSSADFGSSERLGSWREDDTGPSAASPALSPGGLESDLSRVRHKLRKFLQRRPTMQSLREKGYIRDQVFGCALAVLCERERSAVPRFVQQCIRTVEARGLDIDGLYRISGNLATIQKLRYKVDHDERLDLDDGRWEDVHVITGALKLFFRELPEPLFPFSHFSQFIAAIKLQDQAQRSRCVRDLVRTLPAPNHDTLRLLFQHLCRVIEHGEQNRMSVQSVAIVFGPTLLRPEAEEASMPMTMVFQNQVVELILQQCADIFPPH